MSISIIQNDLKDIRLLVSSGERLKNKQIEDENSAFKFIFSIFRNFSRFFESRSYNNRINILNNANDLSSKLFSLYENLDKLLESPSEVNKEAEIVVKLINDSINLWKPFEDVWEYGKNNAFSRQAFEENHPRLLEVRETFFINLQEFCRTSREFSLSQKNGAITKIKLLQH